jgi:hypothetical protein
MDVDENSRHSMFGNIELSGGVITDNHTARSVARKTWCRNLRNDPEHFP